MQHNLAHTCTCIVYEHWAGCHMCRVASRITIWRINVANGRTAMFTNLNTGLLYVNSANIDVLDLQRRDESVPPTHYHTASQYIPTTSYPTVNVIDSGQQQYKQLSMKLSYWSMIVNTCFTFARLARTDRRAKHRQLAPTARTDSLHRQLAPTARSDQSTNCTPKATCRPCQANWSAAVAAATIRDRNTPENTIRHPVV